MIISKGPQQGSITQDFYFFFKAKAVFTAGTDKSCNKAGSKLRWTWVSPSSKIPPIEIRAEFWGWEGKRDLPAALPAAPWAWAGARLPVTAGCCRATGQTQRWAGQMALGSAAKTGHTHPSESFAKLLYRALLHQSYLTFWVEFPCGHSAFPWASWGMPGLICNRLGANGHQTWISRILPQTRQATPRRSCLSSATVTLLTD